MSGVVNVSTHIKQRVKELAFAFIVLVVLASYPTVVTAQIDLPLVINDENNVLMVLVPAGNFRTGESFESAVSLCRELTSPGEPEVCNDGAIMRSLQQSQNTYIGDFYIDQFEVSAARYSECFEAEVCTFGPLYFHEQYGRNEDMSLPIANASYYDAAIYCAWRGARLPTAIEWEYAARGPAAFDFPWGNEFDGTTANYCDQSCDIGIDTSPYEDDGYSELAPITAYEVGQSWVGAFNLAGNVQEWTSTTYNSEYSQLGRDRLAKGGSYRSNPYGIVSWTGAWLEAEVDLIGFRCARTADGALNTDSG